MDRRVWKFKKGRVCTLWLTEIQFMHLQADVEHVAPNVTGGCLIKLDLRELQCTDLYLSLFHYVFGAVPI